MLSTVLDSEKLHSESDSYFQTILFQMQKKKKKGNPFQFDNMCVLSGVRRIITHIQKLVRFSVLYTEWYAVEAHIRRLEKQDNSQLE